jgi:hypothetical protein
MKKGSETVEIGILSSEAASILAPEPRKPDARLDIGVGEVTV